MPLDAIHHVQMRIVQDIQGTETRTYRTPTGGHTGDKMTVATSALDSPGIDGQTTPGNVWKILGGFITDFQGDNSNGADDPTVYSSHQFNDTFTDYLQYQIVLPPNFVGPPVPYKTIAKATWTLTGTVTATLSGGSYTAGGSTTATVTSNFAPSTDNPNMNAADKSFHQF